jgi:hypothetical protein
MTIEVVVRRAQSSEYNSVGALIETVANETFKDLFALNSLPLEFEDEDWPLALVAVSDEKSVGVIITNQEWVGDLSGTSGNEWEGRCLTGEWMAVPGRF